MFVFQIILLILHPDVDVTPLQLEKVSNDFHTFTNNLQTVFERKNG